MNHNAHICILILFAIGAIFVLFGYVGFLPSDSRGGNVWIASGLGLMTGAMLSHLALECNQSL